MATKPSYVEIMSEYWPEIQVSAQGDGFDYNSLQALDPEQTLPTQEQLDEKAVYITRKAMWKEIQEKRDFRKGAGIKIGANWFHSDDTSRIQQLALTMMGANMPAGIMWKTMQGTFVQMTPQLAGQIFQTIAASDQAVYARAEYHRQHMILDDPLHPENYDYSGGWPMIYSESPEAAALADYQ